MDAEATVLESLADQFVSSREAVEEAARQNPVGYPERVLESASQFYEMGFEFGCSRPDVSDELLAASSANDEGLRMVTVTRQGSSGTSRFDRRHVAGLLLGSAAMRTFLEGSDPWEVHPLAAFMQEGYLDLLSAFAGRPASMRIARAVSGLGLESVSEVRTPWGHLVPAPTPKLFKDHVALDLHPPVRALLITDDVGEIQITSDVSQHVQERATSAGLSEEELFSLACLLGSPADRFQLPVFTWSIAFNGFYFAPTNYGGMLRMGSEALRDVDVGISRVEVEQWAHTIASTHHDSLDVAVKRILSSFRVSEPSQFLIDAVTVWESLVGGNGETTLRVAASLARLLEPEATERAELFLRLKRIYGHRSDVVHGRTFDSKMIAASAHQARRVALDAMRHSYLRGRAWLELPSSSRSVALLLGE